MIRNKVVTLFDLPLTSHGKETFCGIGSCILYKFLALRRALSEVLVRPVNCQTIKTSTSICTHTHARERFVELLEIMHKYYESTLCDHLYT